MKYLLVAISLLIGFLMGKSSSEISTIANLDSENYSIENEIYGLGNNQQVSKGFSSNNQNCANSTKEAKITDDNSLKMEEDRELTEIEMKVLYDKYSKDYEANLILAGYSPHLIVDGKISEDDLELQVEEDLKLMKEVDF